MVGEEVVELVVRGGTDSTTHHTLHLPAHQAAEPLVNLNEESLVLSHEVKAQLAEVPLSPGTARTAELHHLALFSSHLNTTNKY